MATLLTTPLKDRYAALQAERERSWTPTQLEKNAGQRRILTARFDPSLISQPGDELPPQSFAEVDGDVLSLDALTARGSALLLFFRYAGCPACNLALPYYAETLYPELVKRGIPLVALSPQIPERLRDIKARHQLPFAVATDADNALARYIGISFNPDNPPASPPDGWIGEITGTNSWTLPQPAALLVGPGRVIEWLKVSPDWMNRPEADEILRGIDQSRT